MLFLIKIQLGFTITEELNKKIAITRSTLFFKNHSSKILFPKRETKDNGGEFTLNEVPQIQVPKNHKSTIVLNQTWPSNIEE